MLMCVKGPWIAPAEHARIDASPRRNLEELRMDEKSLERRQVVGVIGSGLIAAAPAWRPVPSPAHGQQPIVIKFSHVVAADTPKGKASEFFRKRAEALTG